MTDPMVNATPLRHSRLKLMGQAPAHYAAATEQSTGAMAIGSAADLLILGGGTPLVFPGKTRRGKAWETWRDAQDPDALIITASEMRAAEGMSRAVARHTEATALLTGVRQETLLWENQGRSCRGTPDVRGNGFLTDLKTGETSDPRRFPWKVRGFAYHAQLAWYRDGVTRCGLPTVRDCYIVAVEQKAPYVVTVFRLTDHALDLGDRLNRLWFEQLMVCEASGRFPGYSDSTVELDLPDDSGDAIDIAGTDGPITGEDDDE